MKELGLIYGSLFLECESTTLVSCINRGGKPNVITCSAVFPVQPSYIGVAVGFTRYSHNLIKQSGEFVVNIPPKELEDAMYFCGSRSGRDYNKFEERHLTPKPSRKLKTPIIRECIAWMECKNISQGQTPDHTIFIGEVVAAYAKEEAIDIYSTLRKTYINMGSQ